MENSGGNEDQPANNNPQQEEFEYHNAPRLTGYVSDRSRWSRDHRGFEAFITEQQTGRLYLVQAQEHDLSDNPLPLNHPVTYEDSGDRAMANDGQEFKLAISTRQLMVRTSNPPLVRGWVHSRSKSHLRIACKNNIDNIESNSKFLGIHVYIPDLQDGSYVEAKVGDYVTFAGHSKEDRNGSKQWMQIYRLYQDMEHIRKSIRANRKHVMRMEDARQIGATFIIGPVVRTNLESEEYDIPHFDEEDFFNVFGKLHGKSLSPGNGKEPALRLIIRHLRTKCNSALGRMQEGRKYAADHQMEWTAEDQWQLANAEFKDSSIRKIGEQPSSILVNPLFCMRHFASNLITTPLTRLDWHHFLNRCISEEAPGLQITSIRTIWPTLQYTTHLNYIQTSGIQTLTHDVETTNHLTSVEVIPQSLQFGFIPVAEVNNPHAELDFQKSNGTFKVALHCYTEIPFFTNPERCPVSGGWPACPSQPPVLELDSSFDEVDVNETNSAHRKRTGKGEGNSKSFIISHYTAGTVDQRAYVDRQLDKFRRKGKVVYMCRDCPYWKHMQIFCKSKAEADKQILHFQKEEHHGLFLVMRADKFYASWDPNALDRSEDDGWPADHLATITFDVGKFIPSTIVYFCDCQVAITGARTVLVWSEVLSKEVLDERLRQWNQFSLKKARVASGDKKPQRERGPFLAIERHQSHELLQELAAKQPRGWVAPPPQQYHVRDLAEGPVFFIRHIPRAMDDDDINLISTYFFGTTLQAIQGRWAFVNDEPQPVVAVKLAAAKDLVHTRDFPLKCGSGHAMVVGAKPQDRFLFAELIGVEEQEEEAISHASQETVALEGPPPKLVEAFELSKEFSEFLDQMQEEDEIPEEEEYQAMRDEEEGEGDEGDEGEESDLSSREGEKQEEWKYDGGTGGTHPEGTEGEGAGEGDGLQESSSDGEASNEQDGGRRGKKCGPKGSHNGNSHSLASTSFNHASVHIPDAGTLHGRDPSKKMQAAQDSPGAASAKGESTPLTTPLNIQHGRKAKPSDAPRQDKVGGVGRGGNWRSRGGRGRWSGGRGGDIGGMGGASPPSSPLAPISETASSLSSTPSSPLSSTPPSPLPESFYRHFPSQESPTTAIHPPTTILAPSSHPSDHSEGHEKEKGESKEKPGKKSEKAKRGRKRSKITQAQKGMSDYIKGRQSRSESMMSSPSEQEENEESEKEVEEEESAKPRKEVSKAPKRKVSIAKEDHLMAEEGKETRKQGKKARKQRKKARRAEQVARNQKEKESSSGEQEAVARLSNSLKEAKVRDRSRSPASPPPEEEGRRRRRSSAASESSSGSTSSTASQQQSAIQANGIAAD
jgi:hypothetical protein